MDHITNQVLLDEIRSNREHILRLLQITAEHKVASAEQHRRITTLEVENTNTLKLAGSHNRKIVLTIVASGLAFLTSAITAFADILH